MAKTCLKYKNLYYNCHHIKWFLPSPPHLQPPVGKVTTPVRSNPASAIDSHLNCLHVEHNNLLYFWCQLSALFLCVSAQDCMMGEWSAWSECSNTCGKGSKTRKRPIIQYRAFGGGHCPTPTKAKKICHGDSGCLQQSVEYSREEMMGEFTLSWLCVLMRMLHVAIVCLWSLNLC